MSCTPYADCQKVIEFDENSGEIKMLKPSQDEFNFQLTFTVKVCFKNLFLRLGNIYIDRFIIKNLCFVLQLYRVYFRL